MKISATFIIAVALSAFVSMADAQSAKVEAITSDALTRVKFELGDGHRISLFVPSDIRPGDRIAVRMKVEETVGAPDDLAIDLAGVSQPLTNGLAEWDIPDDADTGVTLALVASDGAPLARIDLPLRAAWAEDQASPGRAGGGLRVLGRSTAKAEYTPLPDDFFDGIEIMAASPRAVVIFDSLVLDTRPPPVLCCSEGGPCGLTSCCDFIPSSSCLFCNVSGYDACLLDAGPPTHGGSPN